MIIVGSKRFWEIDMLRGIAIVMMVIFHIMFDLKYFKIIELELYSGPIFFFWLPIPLLFLMLVGISMTLKENRSQEIFKETKRMRIEGLIKRGLFIFGCGLLITGATWILIGDGVIIFGILHLIGLSIIISIPFLHHRWFTFFIGILLIIIGLTLFTIKVDTYWLLAFGLRPRGFYTLDYYPLLPWLGVVLIGIFLGNSLYANYKRQFIIPDAGKNPLVQGLGFLGRNSLLIYFLHQPVIITFFVTIGLIETGTIF